MEQGQPLPVALASDAAFHFRYQETSELLEHMGMPVLRWSPLADEAIPADAKGLILPGGFPEQHAAQLSGCTRSLEARCGRSCSSDRSTPNAAGCLCSESS